MFHQEVSETHTDKAVKCSDGNNLETALTLSFILLT